MNKPLCWVSVFLCVKGANIVSIPYVIVRINRNIGSAPLRTMLGQNYHGQYCHLRWHGVLRLRHNGNLCLSQMISTRINTDTKEHIFIKTWWIILFDLTAQSCLFMDSKFLLTECLNMSVLFKTADQDKTAK